MTEFLNSVGYNFDTTIFYFFGQIQCEFLNFFAEFLSLFAGEFAFFTYIVISLLLCISPKTRRYGVGLFIALTIGALVTNIALKPEIARPRPYIGLKNSSFWEMYQQFYQFAGSHTESTYSFPSGHATLAFDVAVSMTLTSSQIKKRSVGPILITFALLISLSRIYLMVHYPTDVLTGMIIGTIAGLIGGYSALALHFKFEKQALEKQILEEEKEFESA